MKAIKRAVATNKFEKKKLYLEVKEIKKGAVFFVELAFR